MTSKVIKDMIKKRNKVTGYFTGYNAHKNGRGMKSGSEKKLNKWKTNNEAETVVCQEKLAIVCVFPDAGTCFYYYF